MHDPSANDKGSSAGCGERQPAERLQGAAAPTLTEQSHPPSHALGLLEQLPADLLASYIWGQLPRRDRKLLRQAARSVAQYAASELMRHLQVRVCRASLLQVTSSGRTLHQRFPHPASLELRLLPPPARRDAGDGAADGGGGAADGGWHGSTAVMSYFLSELGVATSVTSLSLQGWQELSPRDLHHVAATYPRLARLHLAGLPYNNYFSGSALASLAAAAAGATAGAGGRGGPSPPSGPFTSLSPSPSASASASSTRAPPGCCSQLQVVVVETQLLMEPQAALVSLSRLPQLVSLELTGVPLLPSLEEDALPLSRLTGLTRLVVTFEHKHAQSERQLVGLGALSGLRELGLDFTQLGTGSSLWSAGWLLTNVLGRLTRLTSLHLPRAFLYDKSHPYFLQTLAAMPDLTDLALGSIILSPETAAAAAAATATPAGATPGGVGGGGAAAAAAITPSPAGRLPAEAGASTAADSVVGDDGSEARAKPASPPPPPAGVAAALPPSLARRPWRRLALGAGMPCYLETLLPLLLGPAYDTASPVGTVSEEGRGAGQPATPGPALAAASPPATPACVTPFRGGAGGKAGRGGAAAAAGGGLDLLELSTPCTLQMVQLLPRFVRRTGPACTTATPAAAAAAGSGAGAGVGEVRLMLRLSANWAEVLAAAAAVGPALTSLALLPTYLYGSGTMMTPQVVSAVATSLPLLEHLELYRLNTDPRDVVCLADMPRLRYVLVGVADEARERRGAGHPESLVRSLLAALHAKRSRGGSSGSSGESGSSSRDSSSSSKDGSNSGKRSITAVGGATDARGVVVCCPELSEDDAARLDELCELEFGMYDMYGSRLRVERWQDGSLPWRLAVGCSLAPGQWRGRD